MTPLIDGLQYANWSEKIFRQMRAGGVDAVHVTITYHETFRETVQVIERWNRWFELFPDLIFQGRTAADVSRARDTGRIEQRLEALGIHVVPIRIHFGDRSYLDKVTMTPTEFYRELFAFDELPDSERFGILPKGRILRSPCGTFHLQLIEPEPGIAELDGEECLQRMGLGTPDVPAAVAVLRQRGVDFAESTGVHVDQRGALTRSWLGSVMFELVQDKG